MTEENTLMETEMVPPAPDPIADDALNTRITELTALARQHLAKRKWAEAERAYEQVLMLQQQVEDRIGIARTKNDLASLFLVQREWQKAIDLLERSQAIFEAAHDPEQESVALNNLAAAQYELGLTEQALANYETALEMRHNMGDLVGEAKTLRNLGILYAKQGNSMKAKAYLNRGIAVARQANARELVQIIRKSLSQLPRR